MKSQDKRMKKFNKKNGSQTANKWEKGEKTGN